MTQNADGVNLRERIRRVIRDVTGVAPENDDQNLRDVGVDSFKLIELATTLEDRFSVSIRDERLQWCSMETVARIGETITEALSSHGVDEP